MYEHETGVVAASNNQTLSIKFDAADATELQTIRVFTLGRFSIQLLTDPEKNAASGRQQKPQELLQALVSMGGRNISTDSICYTLWPDAEGDSASNSLDVNLHRLRRKLGSSKTILASGGRLTINNKMVWVDVWAYEKSLNRIDKLLTQPDSMRDIALITALFNKTLEMYQGSYLSYEPPKSWSLSLRERLRSKTLRHISDIGLLLENNQDWNDAIRFYQRGLEIDPFAEELYQRIMTCLKETDRFAEGIAMYQRCRTNLSTGLNITPSSKTEGIRKTLYK